MTDVDTSRGRLLRASGLNRALRFLLRCGVRLAAILLVAAVAMLLVRYGPGFETDERDLDPTLSASVRAQIHARRAADGRIVEYSKNFLAGAVHGDFGVSEALGVPVRDLIVERGPATLRILAIGTAAAWLLGLLWAIAVVVLDSSYLSGASTVANSLLLCLPVAAIAALTLSVRWPAEVVMGIALLPKVFQVSRDLIRQAVQRPESLVARARGIGTFRIFGYYVLPRIAGPLLAWFVATIGFAIAAVVPIEVICDVPGLGQLAWKAALARDLPVLLVLTLLIAVVIQISNSATSLVSADVKGQRA